MIEGIDTLTTKIDFAFGVDVLQSQEMMEKRSQLVILNYLRQAFMVRSGENGLRSSGLSV